VCSDHLKKIKIVYYTGHCEIVGGDAKYVMDLVNEIDSSLFDVSLYTDINHVFEERADQWLSSDIKVNYLDTKPRLFERSKLDAIIDNISNFVFFRNIFNYTVKGYNLKRLIKRLVIAIRLKRLRADITNFLLFRKLLLKERNADVFHYNNGGYPGKRTGLFAIIIASWLGMKTVMTVQNYPVPRKKIAILENLMDCFINKYCDVLIPVADKLGDALVDDRAFSRSKLHTIYHGIMPHRLLITEDKLKLRRDLGIESKDFVMIITANLGEERKGHSVLFESLASVKKKTNDFKLLVVGDGRLRVQLEKLSQELNLRENILFLGHRKDIALLNSISDIAINPSIMYEGIPYTIREAMLESKPVITTSAGGNEEAVFDGVNGLIVDQGDSVTLYRAIIKLMFNDQLRDDMGKKSLEIFNQKFLLKNKVLEHEQLYKEILVI